MMMSVGCATHAVNADPFVLAGAVVHIPVAGNPAVVTKNLNVFPATAVSRADSELTYAIDTYYAAPRRIPKLDTYELSYDKRMSVVGEDALDPTSVIPKPLALGLVGAVTILLGWMVYPAIQSTSLMGSVDLASVLWGQRVLDVWIQIVLIFSGVMGVLGLLSERTPVHSDEVHA